MSFWSCPIAVKTLVTTVVRKSGRSKPPRFRKIWLNNDELVPMTKPRLSKPATHPSLCARAPLEKLEPMYLRGAKPYVVGSKEPISNGLNSKTVALREMMRSPGERSSAIRMGMGDSPLANVGSSAIEENVYAGAPSLALMSWKERPRP